MKKVLFLMFLLLLMGLGAAGVKAQVRIGGNTPPNPAAALDLNADDTNSGAKGLALPRVSLTNVSTPLTGTPVVNGMMVYNTNASATGGSGVGIYYWDGSSSKWVKVINSDFTVPLSKITPSSVAPGSFVMFDGSHFIQSPVINRDIVTPSTYAVVGTGTVTWTLVFNQGVTITVGGGARAIVNIAGLLSTDFCTTGLPLYLATLDGSLWFWDPRAQYEYTSGIWVQCFRPSY